MNARKTECLRCNREGKTDDTRLGNSFGVNL